MSRIFISYRRSDAAAEAGRIYDALEPHFGRESIFMDVDVLEAGEDFRARLREAVGQCQVLLAVISKGWLDAQDAAGRRRLDNPADWVRLEIEAALARDIRVIPVLSEGVVMPLANELPQSLQPLVYRHAAFVRHNSDFRRDMERLRGVLQRHFAESANVQPVLRPVQESASQAGLTRSSRQMPRPRAASLATPKFRSITEAATEAATSLGKIVSRRRMLQVLGYSGGGLGAVWLGKVLLQGGENWQLPALETETIDGTTVEFSVATVNVAEKRIAIVRNRADFLIEDLGGGVTLDIIEIPGETFAMGSSVSDVGRWDNEGPQHNVSVLSFGMGKYPITQAQWRAVAALPKIAQDLNPSPAHFAGDNRPIERVSWLEAVEFCQRLSVKSGLEYRLPSEAEWEYACRAGTTTPFHVGETLTADLANYKATEAYNGGPKGNYRAETMVMESFLANAFGLYNMHGNLWEWCADHWHEGYEGAPSKSSAWLTDNLESPRLLRGGAWDATARYCRSSIRFRAVPEYLALNVGFRVSCNVPRTFG